jgi:hypothetical protein
MIVAAIVEMMIAAISIGLNMRHADTLRDLQSVRPIQKMRQDLNGLQKLRVQPS